MYPLGLYEMLALRVTKGMVLTYLEKAKEAYVFHTLLSECGYFRKGALLCAAQYTEMCFVNGICNSSLLNINGSEEYSWKVKQFDAQVKED